jgi:hypothetical protein
MMKARMILSVLVAFGFLAWSVAVSHAGAGSGTLGDAAIVQCYHIEGSAPPHVLDVDDQFVDAPGQSTKLGKAKLLCTPASGTVTSGHSIQSGFADATHVKCYERPASADAPRVLVQLSDPFGNEVVRVLQSKYVCVGAIKECIPPVGEGETCGASTAP